MPTHRDKSIHLTRLDGIINKKILNRNQATKYLVCAKDIAFDNDNVLLGTHTRDKMCLERTIKIEKEKKTIDLCIRYSLLLECTFTFSQIIPFENTM